MQLKPVLVASVTVSVVAVVMWGLAVDWTVTHAEPTAATLIRPGATLASVIAVLCWREWGRDRTDFGRADRDRSLLIRALGRTAPLRRVP